MTLRAEAARSSSRYRWKDLRAGPQTGPHSCGIASSASHCFIPGALNSNRDGGPTAHHRPIMLLPVTTLALLYCFTPGWSITIDSKLEVDPPPSLLVRNSNGELALDSSISPKVVKAFYEIHFVPATGPQDESGNGIVTVSAPQKCPFAVNTELCKYYFTPSKVMAVQRIDDLIEKSKEGTVPVVQGIVPTDKWDTDKFMKEVNDTIHDKVNAVVPLHNKNKTEGVPVYTGTVNTQGVLNKPEFPPRPPPYRPYYPPPARPPYPWNNNGWNNCLQPPCPWRTPYSSQIL